MIQIVSAFVSAAAIVIVAVIETNNKKDRLRTDKRAERRAKESMLAMELQSATCALALVTAKKVNGKQTNGDVEEAMQKALEAQGRYEAFMNSLAANEVAKV